MKKLNRDNNGQSSVWTVLLVIMVILAGWQILGPFLGIPTPSDLLGEYTSEGTEDLEEPVYMSVQYAVTKSDTSCSG